MKMDVFHNERLIFFDGAMGTMLQEVGWAGGEPPEVCNMVRPELVASVHQAYAQVGADVITANTFGANSLKMKPLGYSSEEVIKTAVTIAKEAAGSRLVALDVGPLGQLMAPMGTLSFEDAYTEFSLQVRAGQQAGADLILIETMSDLYEARAAVLAAKEQSRLPVICSLTYQKNGRTLMGNDPLTVITVLEALGVDALGVNCSLGPKDLLPVVNALTKAAHVPILVQANAGLPELIDGSPVYPLDPESYADSAEKMVEMGVKMLGGCCGTNPAFIETLRSRLYHINWNKPCNPRWTVVASARQTILLDKGIHIVGQRINPTGRQDLIQAIQSGDWDLLYEEALMQKQAGAAILDLNVFTGQSNEADNMVKAIEYIQSMAPIPLQLDSVSDRVLDAGARVVNGKPILNSVNGSKQSMEKILPVVRKYGTCVIGMTLDENGIPDTAQGRLEIAERILDNALSLGIKKENLIMDCIVESAAWQPGRTEVTLKSLSLMKRELGLQTILGISNISHGMKNRPSINAAFLAMALGAGLDCAIIDPTCQEVADIIQTYRLITEESP